MDYTITLDEANSVVRLDVFRTSQEGRSLTAAASAGRHAGWRRFLFDFKGAGSAKVIGVFHVASRLGDFGFQRGDRIAFVPAAASTDWAELVATNRGWQVRAFATLPEAKAWLLSSPPT